MFFWITSFYQPVCQDFTSGGLFSKTSGALLHFSNQSVSILVLLGYIARQVEGTGFHAAQSFDSVLCSKSVTMMLLATTKRDSSNKYSQSSSTPFSASVI